MAENLPKNIVNTFLWIPRSQAESFKKCASGGEGLTEILRNCRLSPQFLIKGFLLIVPGCIQAALVWTAKLQGTKLLGTRLQSTICYDS